MGGQPVTTNPFLIMVINMTVVFVVLYGLSLIVRLIRIIDPTQKKNLVKKSPATEAASFVPAPAPAAASVDEDANKVIVLIAAALAACGYGASRIVAIRPVGGRTWAQTARIESVQSRNKMF